MEDPQVGTENLFTSLLSVTSGANSQDISAADTSYHQYPASRPFINTDYQRSPSRPIMSFPESNRDGVLSALRNLQERMQRLEVERCDAENNLRTLASETEAYKTSLHRQSQRAQQQPVDSLRPARQEVPSESEASAPNGLGSTRPKARELESQLSSAETRCQMLEKQLDYMRKMVQSAERDRVEAVQKAENMQQQQAAHHSPRSSFSPDYCTQLERISELERDHLRLTATQTLAEIKNGAVPESKIKELENKLKDERDHRRLLQERALDLESAAVSHQILLNTAPPPSSERDHHPDPKGKGKKPPAAKKKKKLVSRKQIPPKTEPNKHYRLNLADIPFVAGKATTPSHAVGANVQKVLAMMKAHNLALCSSLYNGHSNYHNGGEVGGGRSISPSLSSSSSDQDLADLLAQLQDEFGQLSCEHQDLLRQIQDERDPQIRVEIEKELDFILQKMESKGQQISRVRMHQQKLEDTKQPGKQGIKKGEHVPRPNSAMGRMQAAHRHPHCHSSHPCRRVHTRPRSTSREKEQRYKNVANPSLNVLRDMRKLQSTLRPDDLHWE